MFNNKIKTCRIITFSEDDLLAFSLEFSSSGVEVVIDKNFDAKKAEIDNSIPVIIIGWSAIKKTFPSQKISNRKIKDNLYWTYSVSEDKQGSILGAKSIIKQFLDAYLPNNYIQYDTVLNGRLSSFIKNNFSEPYNTFIYFSGKVLYLYNKTESDKNKIIAISLESLKYSGLDVKSSISAFINKYKPICYSYENISPYINETSIRNPVTTIENIMWAKNYDELNEKLFYNFMMTPSSDSEMDRFFPFLMSEISDSTTELTDHEKIFIDRLYKKDIITSWLSKMELFFDKKYINDKIIFKKSTDGQNYVKLPYSNKRTITGRINCVDTAFNPQMLPKDENGDRKNIISRYKNGKILVFDYISFETKLALFMCGDEKFITEYKNKDLHIETSKIIFEKQETNSEERQIGKKINHAFLYGGGDEILKKILSNKGIRDTDKTLSRVKVFLEPIVTFSEQIKDACDEFGGYIITPQGTMVRPNKMFAAFQNYIQATAADIVIEKLFEIRKFLAESNKKSKFLFQVYDSFVFDVNPDEISSFSTEISAILASFPNFKLDVETKIGDNFFQASL